MNVKQISVFVENKKGRLAEITKALADNKIDISCAFNRRYDRFWNSSPYCEQTKCRGVNLKRKRACGQGDRRLLRLA